MQARVPRRNEPGGAVGRVGGAHYSQKHPSLARREGARHLRSKPYKSSERGPEMHQTKQGSQWHFGMKAHIGVDAESGLVHTVASTAANVNDVTQVSRQMHGRTTVRYGGGWPRVQRSCRCSVCVGRSLDRSVSADRGRSMNASEIAGARIHAHQIGELAACARPARRLTRQFSNPSVRSRDAARSQQTSVTRGWCNNHFQCDSEVNAAEKAAENYQEAAQRSRLPIRSHKSCGIAISKNRPKPVLSITRIISVFLDRILLCNHSEVVYGF